MEYSQKRPKQTNIGYAVGVTWLKHRGMPGCQRMANYEALSVRQKCTVRTIPPPEATHTCALLLFAS